jgi:hypothetical protein
MATLLNLRFGALLIAPPPIPSTRGRSRRTGFASGSPRALAIFLGQCRSGSRACVRKQEAQTLWTVRCAKSSGEPAGLYARQVVEDHVEVESGSIGADLLAGQGSVGECLADRSSDKCCNAFSQFPAPSEQNKRRISGYHGKFTESSTNSPGLGNSPREVDVTDEAPI